MKLLSLLVTVLVTLSAHAEIREIQSMKQIAPAITAHTLVVFDIDNTLLEAAQTLGTDQAFGYLVDQQVKAGRSKQDATARMFAKIAAVQAATHVQPVEAGTPWLVSRIQRLGLPVVALTARPPTWAEATVRQLHDIHVDFASSSPATRTPQIADQAMYGRGILFVRPGGDKGKALVAFLQETGLNPKRIIFVDDKAANITSVETALNQYSVEHISFRYGAADQRVASFDPKVLEVELLEFVKSGNLVSDEEASQRAHQN